MGRRSYFITDFANVLAFVTGLECMQYSLKLRLYHLQEGLWPSSSQLLFQLGQALLSAEAAAQQISGVVQISCGVERDPLLLLTSLCALLALFLNLDSVGLCRYE